MRAAAVLPTKMQMPGNDAGLRCAALFEKYSSECQECVAGGGAFLEWPEGKGECATKPKGPAISKPPECAFAGKAGKNCIECLFQKKWKVCCRSPRSAEIWSDGQGPATLCADAPPARSA